MPRLLLIDGENFKGKVKSVFKQPGRERPLWHEYDFRGPGAHRLLVHADYGNVLSTGGGRLKLTPLRL